MRLPIDRGWGWVMTFACGCLFLWTAGHAKSRGIILVELMELYPEKSATSILWIFGLATLCNRVSGPFNGWLLARTSSRFVAMFGVGTMTISLTATAYVPSIEYMYIIYGVIYGIGNGMVLLTLYTASAPYFDKRRALSVGLTSAGSGLGMTVFSILTRLLFDNYTFSGAMLLSAGLCLQTMVLAALLRPFSYYSRWVKPTCDADSEKALAVQDNSSQYSSSKQDFRERSTSLGSRKLQKAIEENHNSVFLSVPDQLGNVSPKRSLDAKKTNQFSSLPIMSISQQDLEGSGIIPIEVFPEPREPDQKKEKKKFYWRLAYNPKSITFGLAMLTYSSGLGATLQCIPPLGKEIGMSKNLVSILMSAAGGVEIFTRVFNGWFADQKFISASTHVALCMVFTGFTALLCATLRSTAGIIVMLVGMSFTGTSVFSLMPATCNQLFGKEHLESAMSINFVYIGLANVVTTFSIGGIYDATGRWSYAYYYVFVLSILGSFFMSVVTYVIWKRTQSATEVNTTLEK